MSRHLPRRLTPTHRVMAITLLFSLSSAALPSIAQAISFGKTSITSTQNEPLTASMIVQNINAADFSVSLANLDLYKKMELTPNHSMTVHFVPTSADAGQIFINTTKPITIPFADVILALNNKGQNNVIPKTLLLPLRHSNSIDVANTAAAHNNSDSNTNFVQKIEAPLFETHDVQPLMVARGVPPPLFIPSNIQRPLQVEVLKNEASLPTIVPTTSAYSGMTDQYISATNTNYSNTVNNATLTIENKQKPRTLPTMLTADSTFVVLNIQETRRIQATNRRLINDSSIEPATLVDATPKMSQTNEFEARLTETHNQQNKNITAQHQML